MTARERASQYIAILWPDTDGTWLMQDGDQVKRFARAVTP